MNLAKSSVKSKIIKARISEEEYKTILEQCFSFFFFFVAIE